jgi:tripartite-type tricarboxylate transporter receptor subunit TctC
MEEGSMNALFRFLGVLGLVWFSSLAQAQGFPSKPIMMIVPWPAGGSSDLHMRAFAEIASKHLGQPIVVENKPGAGGTLGPVTMAQTAKPDGYTLAQFPISLLRYPHIQKLAVDPIKDFT